MISYEDNTVATDAVYVRVPQGRGCTLGAGDEASFHPREYGT
jgi:hypothetical protein